MSEETDIGKQLRKARESKNLSHADIAESTRIPATMLVALERQDYSDLSPAYARSFLIQYSEFLSVDASKSVELFRSDDSLSRLSEHSYLQQGSDRIRNKGEKSAFKGRSSQSRSGFSPLELTQAIRNSASHPIVIYIALVGALALFIAGGIYSYQTYNGRNSALGNDQASATDDSSTRKSNRNDQIRDNSQSAESDIVSKAYHADLFDPLSSTSKLLVIADDSETDEAQGAFIFGESNYDRFSITPEKAINQEDNKELSERNSPPPKAMVIDEDDE